jgi:hypothetical protein
MPVAWQRRLLTACGGVLSHLAPLTKPILARRTTADRTKQYGKVRQQRQEGFVSGAKWLSTPPQAVSKRRCHATGIL